MGETEVHALRGASLRVASGEFLALMGPSGSGKSTLMHLLGFLDTPTAGSYRFQRRDVSTLSDRERARVRKDRGQRYGAFPHTGHVHNNALH